MLCQQLVEWLADSSVSSFRVALARLVQSLKFIEKFVNLIFPSDTDICCSRRAQEQLEPSNLLPRCHSHYNVARFLKDDDDGSRQVPVSYPSLAPPPPSESSFGRQRQQKLVVKMIDIMKSLVYVLCLCSCFEAFVGLKSFRKPLINDRMFGWLGFAVKSAETLIGFLFEGLKVPEFLKIFGLSPWTSSSQAASVASRGADVVAGGSSASSKGLSDSSASAIIDLQQAQERVGGVIGSLKFLPAKMFRAAELLALSSMAIFFTGEYNLRLISRFLKTISCASLIGFAVFYERYPPALELISNAFFPVAMTALIAVSSLSDNGHLFWAVFNTVFFDKFSESGAALEAGASYNSAVTLNFFVNALREVVVGTDSELNTPTTDTFVDIYVIPPSMALSADVMDAVGADAGAASCSAAIFEDVAGSCAAALPGFA